MLEQLSKEEQIVLKDLIKAESNKKNTWEHFKRDAVAGSISGAAVGLLTHPLDTMTVRDQTNTGKTWKFKELYKGVGPRTAKTVAASTIGFPAFMAAARGYDNIMEKKAYVPLVTAMASRVLPAVGNFARGLGFMGRKGQFTSASQTLKGNRAFIAGRTGALGSIVAAPTIKKTNLEQITKGF